VRSALIVIASPSFDQLPGFVKRRDPINFVDRDGLLAVPPSIWNAPSTGCSAGNPEPENFGNENYQDAGWKDICFLLQCLLSLNNQGAWSPKAPPAPVPIVLPGPAVPGAGKKIVKGRNLKR